jgi:hypothetical protein
MSSRAEERLKSLWVRAKAATDPSEREPPYFNSEMPCTRTLSYSEQRPRSSPSGFG